MYYHVWQKYVNDPGSNPNMMKKPAQFLHARIAYTVSVQVPSMDGLGKTEK